VWSLLLERTTNGWRGFTSPEDSVLDFAQSRRPRPFQLIVRHIRKVVFAASLSLDGYIEATTGDSSLVFLDEEVHRHFNDLEQDIDTHLYGRRMYEPMVTYWPTADQNPSAPRCEIEYARMWKAVPKVVFLSRLQRITWNARVVSGSAEAEVASFKVQPGKNVSVGSFGLTSALAAAGLMDKWNSPK
jgi:dihydrofolate reductase